MNRARFLRLLGGGLAAAVMGSRLAAAQRAGGAATGGFDFWFTRLKYNSGDWDVDQRMPANLITSLIDYTSLRVDPKEQIIDLSDPRMLSSGVCNGAANPTLGGNAVLAWRAHASASASSVRSRPPTSPAETRPR